MATNITKYREQVLEEIEKTPLEYLPALLRLIRIFRESVTLKSAEDSFKQGWKEAIAGDTEPISKLWEGLDSE